MWVCQVGVEEVDFVVTWASLCGAHEVQAVADGENVDVAAEEALDTIGFHIAACHNVVQDTEDRID